MVSVLASPPSATACILVPSCDEAHFQKLHPVPKYEGPLEISVVAKLSQSVYKRQVMLVHVASQTSVKPAKATYQAVLKELKEIVFEMDSRLLNRDMLSKMNSSPQETMKARILESFPSSAMQGAVLYAFKRIAKKGDHCIYQYLTKVTSASRDIILEHSLMSDVSARDFVERGVTQSDHSVLPRFWEISRAGREELLKTANGVEGVAGLVITKRGLAVRSWNGKLAATRKAIMGGDCRLCDENMATIPRIQVESSGWPPNITASEIVKSVQFYTKLAPIPSRAYRASGVTSWSLLFSELPTIQKFFVDFNGKIHEILLTKHDQTAPFQSRKGKERNGEKGKGKGKEKTKSAMPPPQADNDATSDRLTSLESRFTLMEKKQSSLESRVDSSFSEVNDQLRQILQAVCPRSPSHGATGLTPPPKQMKTGQ